MRTFLTSTLAVVLLYVCACAMCDTASGAIPAPPAPPAPKAAPAVKPAVAPAAKPADASAVDRMTLKQRRELGLTVVNITRIAKQLKKSGEQVTAANIREHLATEAPKAYAVAAPNWDNILAFIEKLLPLILKLIDLFGQVTPDVPSPTMPAHLEIHNDGILAQWGCQSGSCAAATTIVRVPVVVEVKAEAKAVVAKTATVTAAVVHNTATKVVAVPRGIVCRLNHWRPVRRLLGR